MQTKAALRTLEDRGVAPTTGKKLELHSLERKGYLRPKQERSGSRYRKIYRITPPGRRALSLARRRVQELFGEMFARRLNS